MAASDLVEIKLNESMKLVIDCNAENLGRFAECDALHSCDEINDLPCKGCFLNTRDFFNADLCDYPYFKDCIRKRLLELCNKK